MIVVGTCASRAARRSMPQWAASASMRAPGSSSPITPTSVALAPSTTALNATFAAPPRRSSLRVTRTTGTGASGEIRETSPNQ